MKTMLVCGCPSTGPRGVDSSWPCTCIHLLVGLSVRSFCLQVFKASSPHTSPPLEVPHLVSSSTDTFRVITPLVVSLQTGSLLRLHRDFCWCARKIGALHPPPPQPNFTQTCSSKLACRLSDCRHSKGCHRYLLKIPPSFGLIAT